MLKLLGVLQTTGGQDAFVNIKSHWNKVFGFAASNAISTFCVGFMKIRGQLYDGVFDILRQG